MTYAVIVQSLSSKREENSPLMFWVCHVQRHTWRKYVNILYMILFAIMELQMFRVCVNLHSTLLEWSKSKNNVYFIQLKTIKWRHLYLNFISFLCVIENFFIPWLISIVNFFLFFIQSFLMWYNIQKKKKKLRLFINYLQNNKREE